MQTTEIVNTFDVTALKDILFIERHSFPIEWAYTDAEQYYREMLLKEDNIHIFLKDNGNRIGYLLAIPHNDAVKELKKDDPQMEEDSKRYYIETVTILPEFRGRKGFSEILKRLIEQSKIKGNNISLHARVENGFSTIIQKKLNVTKIRRINKWKYYNYAEPADYIEAILSFNS
jgi:ribosomal protein S18 acetylase RimI-like enzyme